MILESVHPSAPPDDAAALAVVGAIAATFVAVALYFYLPSVRWVCVWYFRRAKRRLARSRRLLRVAHIGRVLWAVDIVFVVGWRGCVALYVLPVLIFIGPLLLTIGSLSLAASLVAP